MARVPNAGAVERRTSTRVIAATGSRCALAALIALGLAGCFEANSDGAAPAASVSGGRAAPMRQRSLHRFLSGEPGGAGDRAEGAGGLLDGS